MSDPAAPPPEPVPPHRGMMRIGLLAAAIIQVISILFAFVIVPAHF